MRGTYVTKPRPCGVCRTPGNYRVTGTLTRFYCEAHAAQQAFLHPEIVWAVQRPPRPVWASQPYGPQRAFVPVRHVSANPAHSKTTT